MSILKCFLGQKSYKVQPIWVLLNCKMNVFAMEIISGRKFLLEFGEPNQTEVFDCHVECFLQKIWDSLFCSSESIWSQKTHKSWLILACEKSQNSSFFWVFRDGPNWKKVLKICILVEKKAN